MMRFIVDEQLPPRVADWLQGKGHEANHIKSIEPGPASDRKIVELAIQTRAIIVSKDSDFPSLLERLPSAPQLVWLRVGNTLNRALIQRLEAEWPRMERDLLIGMKIVELH
jgi:predicted nuclease of predicted toxin-antitoxin system